MTNQPQPTPAIWPTAHQAIMAGQSPAIPGSSPATDSAHTYDQSDNAGPWVHDEDGTPCPNFWSDRPTVDEAGTVHWWCTEHQQNVHIAAQHAEKSQRDQQLADYLAAMDEAGGAIYAADFCDGFRHALAMVAAYESNEEPAPGRARPEVREAARMVLSRLTKASADALPDGVRPIGELREAGLLWLINTSVFHPRGLALALCFAEDDRGHETPLGWRLLAAPDGEAFDFIPADVDELYRAAEATLAAARSACACEPYLIRTDYGAGIEHDVDQSSCQIHGGWNDRDGDQA